MHLDFWNNPIIVSAFRVKYRKGGLFTRTALYLLFLTLGGGIFQYYQDRLGRGNWVNSYFLTMMCLQFVVSAVLANATTGTSIKSEVVNRTLDFQRIATLSPRQILLGKLLGEPARAYLLAIATIPLSVYCMLMGGVALDVLVMLYVNLATTTVLFGTIGLGNRLEPPAGQADVSFVGLVGLVTPFPLFTAMRQPNPWSFGAPFWDLVIPAFVGVPIVQLGMAYLCFHAMERRLLNPLLPTYSKRLSYLLLFLIDATAGAVIYFPPVPIFPLGYKCVLFCLVHLLASLWLMTTVTPWRETLHSWVWRFRDRLPRPHDLWLGPRSANDLALVTYCLMGVVGLVAFVIVPAGLVSDWEQVRQGASPAASAMLLTIVLILALGTVHQRAVLLAGRTGTGAFALLIIILDLPPNLLGMYYGSDTLLTFSPSAHFIRWFREPALPLNLAPVVALYGLIFALAWLSFHRRMQVLERVVDQKLRLMGVLPAGGQ